MYSIMARCFPIWQTIEDCSEWVEVSFRFGASWSPSDSFPMWLILSAFLLCSLRSHILLQNRFVSLSPGCWYMFAGRIFFRYFGKPYFVFIVLFCLDIFLDFFFSFSVLWFLLAVVDFLSVSNRIPPPGFELQFVFLGERRFFRRLFSLWTMKLFRSASGEANR